MIRILAIVALVASTTTVRADEAYNFHGLKLGTPLNEIEGHGRWQCVHPRSDPIACTHDGTSDDAVGGLVPTDIWVMFRDGRVLIISVFFAHIDIETLIDAMKMQYGPPTEETPYTDFRGGQTFENYRVVWRKGTSSVAVIKRIRAGSDDSVIVYTFSDVMEPSAPLNPPPNS